MIKRRQLLVLSVLPIVAAGCFKVELKVTVEDDGSGQIEGLTAVDAGAMAEFGSIFEESGADAPSRDELCADFLADSDLPEGATTEPYDEGDFCGARFSQTFSPTEMDAVLADMSSDDGDFVIRRDGDGWRFDATFSTDTTAGAEFFPEELFDDAEFIVRVKLPGHQVEHNADRIESDGTMVWEVDILNPGADLMARTEPGTPITGSGGGDDGSNSVLIALLVLLAVGAAGVGVWWLLRKRSAGSGSSEDELAPPVPSGSPTPVPPPLGPPSSSTTGPPPPPPLPPPPVESPPSSSVPPRPPPPPPT